MRVCNVRAHFCVNVFRQVTHWNGRSPTEPDSERARQVCDRGEEEREKKYLQLFFFLNIILQIRVDFVCVKYIAAGGSLHIWGLAIILVWFHGNFDVSVCICLCECGVFEKKIIRDYLKYYPYLIHFLYFDGRMNKSGGC